MTLLRNTNLALAFGLELCALAALGYWGWHTRAPTLLRFGLALAAPLLAAVLWGMFVAPRAAFQITPPLRLLVEWSVWVAAIAGLALAGRTGLALIFGVAVVANHLLVLLLKP